MSILKGIESYYLTTYNDSTGYYGKYEIDLTDVTGIRELSGDIYSGGGYNIVQVKSDYINGSISGRIKMNETFKSPGKSITLTENALFIYRNNKTSVQFDTGYTIS